MLRDVAYDGFLRHDGRLLNGLGLLTSGVDDGSWWSAHQRVTDRYMLNVPVYAVNGGVCQFSCINVASLLLPAPSPIDDDVIHPHPRFHRESL